MKLGLLSGFIFFIVGFSNSQDYYSFPDSIARWVNTGYNVSGSFSLVYSEFYCMNNEDTLINNKNYTKINFCLTQDYKGAVRDTAGKVYYVPNDSINEYLLYDFWAEPGDTLNYYHEGYGGSTGYIDHYIVGQWDTSYVLIDGQYRRMLQVEGSRWIEGIGCMQGMFLSPHGNISNYAPFLYCMSEDDTTFASVGWEAGWPGECDLFIGLEENSLSTLNVYPNPTDGLIKVSHEGKIDRIYIINLLGKYIDVPFIQNNSILEINAQNVEPGVYFLHFESQINTRSIKIVIE